MPFHESYRHIIKKNFRRFWPAVLLLAAVSSLCWSALSLSVSVSF